MKTENENANQTHPKYPIQFSVIRKKEALSAGTM